MKLKQKAAVLAAVLAGATYAPAALAQDMYIGQVILMASSYCPRGTVEASGQTMSIPQNQALFALMGNAFGGDNATKFNLPNLAGRAPVGLGVLEQSAPQVKLGTALGSRNVSLQANQVPVPPITVTLPVSKKPATDVSPSDAKNTLSAIQSGLDPAFAWGAKPSATTDLVNVPLTVAAVSGSGSTPLVPVNVQSPVLGLRFCVVTNGIWPDQP